jgi:chromosome segregation ATPase
MLNDYSLNQLNHLYHMSKGNYWFLWDYLKQTCRWASDTIKKYDEALSFSEGKILELEQKARKLTEEKNVLNEKHTTLWGSFVNVQSQRDKLLKDNLELTDKIKQQRSQLQAKDSDAELEWIACRDEWIKAEENNKRIIEENENLRTLVERLKLEKKDVQQDLESFQEVAERYRAALDTIKSICDNKNNKENSLPF